MKPFLERLHERVPPEQYLSLTNVLSTGIGFVKGLIAVSLLTPELFGAVAIIASINRTVVNLIDIRLNDIAGKLYYETEGMSEHEVRVYRQNVLGHAALGGILIATISGVLSFFVGVGTVNIFTDADIPVWWLAAHALMIAVSSIVSYLIFLQRFIGYFYTFGTLRVISHIIEMAIYAVLFYSIGEIDGYYVANVVGGLIFLVLTVVSIFLVWVRRDQVSFSDFKLGYTVSNYLENRSMLIYGNFLGYGKLLHRAADTLVVSLFANDAITGLYKFARTLTDSLYVFYDALNQVYQPRFLALLAERAFGEFRRLARLFALRAVAATSGVILLEILLLPFLLRFVSDGAYVDAVSSIVIMTIPVALIVGLQIWMTQIFIHAGRLGRYTVVTLLACIVQYGVMIALFLTLPADPIFGTLGYLGYYLFSIPIWYRLGQSILKEKEQSGDPA